MNTLDEIIRETAVPRASQNLWYPLRIQEDEGTYKGNAKKSEARNEQRFPFARIALLLARWNLLQRQFDAFTVASIAS